PDSVMASIGALVKTYKGAKIMLVLGDMEELGEQEEALHRKVGEFIAGLPVHTLVTVGKKARMIAESANNGTISINAFNSKEEAGDFLANNLNGETVALFKASRAVRLEDVAEKLKGE
ncbi:MAG: UDP-N-acetylmuramoyl-tripeptide--D-alanyl-D-alanine ligase, partial [Candidatus Gastranaerophilales bacterium]|nr:UDP-N-acetylmuramoyl-tripeptide--D-alanyl-D-alanine ligase [Candidatus Gastranaerophilales bacterium]